MKASWAVTVVWILGWILLSWILHNSLGLNSLAVTFITGMTTAGVILLIPREEFMAEVRNRVDRKLRENEES